MKAHILSYLLMVVLCCSTALGQVDSSLFRRVERKDTVLKLNQDAVYNRPFLTMAKIPVSIGGYAEANSQYEVQNGISEGLSFQMRRLTLFVASSVGKRIRFLTELEFEDGTKEINIEFASVDVEFHPLLNLRTGILMNPIGAFNQNHDGPKWEFTDRPIASTTIVPATWSNVGFGLWGKYYSGAWAMGYEVYLTNGFDERITNNSQNRTWLPATKSNPDRFEESTNGQPLTTAKMALRHKKAGEIGLSWMGGVYNRYKADGVVLDKKRRVDVWAIDFNTVVEPTHTYINGEWIWARINVPATLRPQFGGQQTGGVVDVVQPVWRRPMLGFEQAVLNLALRAEYTDYNVARFEETGKPVGDAVFGLMPGISFRPYPQTVLRASYRYQTETDLFGNPPIASAVYQIGLSSYF